MDECLGSSGVVSIPSILGLGIPWVHLGSFATIFACSQSIPLITCQKIAKIHKSRKTYSFAHSTTNLEDRNVVVTAVKQRCWRKLVSLLKKNDNYSHESTLGTGIHVLLNIFLPNPLWLWFIPLIYQRVLDFWLFSIRDRPKCMGIPARCKNRGARTFFGSWKGGGWTFFRGFRGFLRLKNRGQ